MRRLRILAVVPAGVAVLLSLPVPAGAAAPWWQPLGLRGTAVESVRAEGRTVVVATAGPQRRVLRSSDGGRSFSDVPAGELPPRPPIVDVGGEQWVIRGDGVVLHRGSGAPMVDGGAPALGRGARLIAAPAAAPGIVVAVATDGTVWRRAQDGGWQRSLLLLPAGFPSGVPRVTAVAAFNDKPLSTVVYLATDGYAVLDSTDGGDDWVRAGPGLPASVLDLATDSTSRAVYAATGDGLWVHHLQSIPAPAVYSDAALVWRWIGIALVTLAGAAIGILLLRWAVPRRT